MQNKEEKNDQKNRQKPKQNAKYENSSKKKKTKN